MPLYSIVVVTHNRPKDCALCLRSLARQNFKDFEVILLNTGDYDLCKGLNKLFRKFKYFKLPSSVSLGLARSYGVLKAEGLYIAFIDDDAIAHRIWLEKLLEKHEEGYDIVGGKILPYYLFKPPNWWDETIFGDYVSIRNDVYNTIFGANFSVSKKVFERIGYFHPYLGRWKGKLLGGEETEFIKRAKNRGFKTILSNEAIVFHRIPSYRIRLSYLMRMSFNKGRTLKILNTIIREKSKINILIEIIRLIYDTKEAIKCTITKEKKSALKHLLYAFRHLGYILTPYQPQGTL